MKTKKRRPFLNFIYGLYYGRNARSAFKRREKQISLIDKRLALAVAAFVFALSLLAVCASAVMGSLAEKRILFTIIAAVSALVMLAYIYTLKKGMKLPISVHYGYYAVVLTAVLLGSVIRGYEIKTLFCMLMILFPMFTMDKPGRTNLVFMAFLGAFLFVVHQLEPEDMEKTMLTALAAFAAGCFISRYQVHSRLNDMIYKAHIERERDTDGLTRLYTRTAAVRDISAFLRGSSERAGECALFLIDIDNFKNVNDTLGHDSGDKLLVDISDTLRGLLRRSDYVSRLGGDEFIIFLADLPSHEWVNAKAAAVNAALCKTVVSGKKRVMVSASIGIAFAEGNASSYESLYRSADKAMYVSKQAGGNSFTVYSDRLFEWTTKIEQPNIR